MPTVHQELSAAVRAAIDEAFSMDADPLVTLSQNPTFGDYQSNAAMSLAKIVAEKTGQKANPRAVAEQIKAKLAVGELIGEVSIAGPGFINIKLTTGGLETRLVALQKHAPSPCTQGEGRGEGSSQLSPPVVDPLPTPLPEYRVREDVTTQTVVVDYSGPNIAKQMHVGHLRSTIIGDCISRVMAFQGNKVIRQNHIGDWGTQFGMLIAHAKEYFAGKVVTSNTVSTATQNPPFDKHLPEQMLVIGDLEQFYREGKQRFDADTNFQTEAKQFVVKLQSGDDETQKTWRAIVFASQIKYYEIYRQLDVSLKDSDERGESFYNDKLADVVAELRAKNIAVESDGAIVVFIDGPEKSPLIIQKSDGGYLYGTTDLAAIRYRVDELHADRIIYTHDHRQAQHFSQVFRTAEKAGWAPKDKVLLEYAPFGTMLGEDGKPFKTRSGDTVKLKDLLDEAEERAFKVVSEKNTELPEDRRRAIAHSIGIGGVKYSDLSKDRTSDYVFSFDKMLALDGNTGPYLQYAYARIRSIFRKAAERDAQPGPAKLESPFELALAKHVLRFDDVIELVSRELKPHHLCAYLYELATKFSGFFENCPVLQSEPSVRASRLTICQITVNTLATGLDLLGIEHPEQM